jgi:SET domain-containing protein
MSSAAQSMLRHLSMNIKARLAVSKVHGIGVVAIRDIKMREEVFRTRVRKDHDRVDLTMQQITDANVPKPVVDYMKSFFFKNDDEHDTYPVHDLNCLDVSFYLNHGGEHDANVEFVPCATIGCDWRCAYEHMVATKDIKAGEELLLNYGLWSTDVEQTEHAATTTVAAAPDAPSPRRKKRS